MQEPEVAYGPPNRLARTDPEYLFLAAIAILALFTLLILFKSGVRELIIGLLGGGWICTIGGLALYLYRKKERS